MLDRRILITCLIPLLAAFGSPAASGAPPSPTDELRAGEDDDGASGPSVADLDWIIGNWRGEKGDGIVEEQWSTAGGGAMMGMFRWLSEDKVRLYEFMLIEAGPEAPVLRLKHFSPGLKGWEEKEVSIEFHLTGHGDERAVFEMDSEIEKTKLVYERTPDGGLEARLLKTKDDGTESATVFNYSRQ
ncbi:MAG: hypothetical protein GY719_21550 [bacterium]|nr:hypothetical protein [bacterium]